MLDGKPFPLRLRESDEPPAAAGRVHRIAKHNRIP
jgi:hypothetical protein